MNKFKRALDFMYKWITILWNTVVVFLCGFFAFYAMGNYIGDYDRIGVLWLVGTTVFVNVMNLWNRILIRSQSNKKK